MIRASQCSAEEVRHLLDAIPSPKTDAAGAIDLADVIARGQVFKITEQDEIVAVYVLEPLAGLLWISAFGGRARFDLVDALAALVEAQGREFDAIGFRTERRGLVRKAQRHGYQVSRQCGAAYFMRKSLRP